MELDRQIEAFKARVADVRERLIDALREFLELSQEAERIGALIVEQHPQQASEMMAMLLEGRSYADTIRRATEDLIKAGTPGR